MKNGRNYLVIDGRNSMDFGVYISGAGTYKAPERNYEEIEIPGRNGVFLFDFGNYKNVDVSYEAFIAEQTKYYPMNYSRFEENIAAFRSFLISRDGYVRIEDTYHPDEFRLGYYNMEFDPDVHQSLMGAQFTITFKCKPQRFLKSGERKLTRGTDFSTNLRNPTNHTATPLIRAYGTGSVTIGSRTIVISRANSYTDIDTELQEAYKDTLATSCNDKIILSNGEFPVLKPGLNTVSTAATITRLEITPRWWTV